MLVLLYFLLRMLWKRVKRRGREELLRELERRKAESTKADLKFLDRVTFVMEENLGNPAFNVNMLGEELHMSRSTLYRKMKGITERSGNDFIKQYRLEKAAKLLAEKSWPVAEIASMTGFSSLSYFSRCFRQQFGVSPKNYSPPKN